LIELKARKEKGLRGRDSVLIIQWLLLCSVAGTTWIDLIVLLLVR
jgi:hypothetical protein